MQLRTILAGVKPGSGDAHPTQSALEFARRADARVILLSVTQSPGQPIRPPVDPCLGARVAAQATVGLPAVEIARWAESQGADMIVLGREVPERRDQSSGGDAVPGTVRRARVPCLLVPPGQLGFRRILAAVDGGPASRDVLDAALLMGRAFGAQVRAVHVEAPALVGAGVPTRARGLVAAADDPLADRVAGVGETSVRQGDPVSEILRMVREESADLLVFGSHRGGSVHAAHTTASVAARLLKRAPCAVLTVPI